MDHHVPTKDYLFKQIFWGITAGELAISSGIAGVPMLFWKFIVAFLLMLAYMSSLAQLDWTGKN